MLLLVSFAVLTLATTLEAAWYNPAWGYRKAVLINSKPDAGDCGTGTCVPAAQVNFPVLVSLASDAALAARAQDDGDDILFTAADGTTQLSLTRSSPSMARPAPSWRPTSTTAR